MGDYSGKHLRSLPVGDYSDKHLRSLPVGDSSGNHRPGQVEVKTSSGPLWMPSHDSGTVYTAAALSLSFVEQREVGQSSMSPCECILYCSVD